MSREWQQTRIKEYVMPDAVYYQTIWAVRDLNRMEERLMEIEKDIQEGYTPGSLVSDVSREYIAKRPTEKRAMEKMILENRIQAIMDALDTIPDNYRECILDNIMNRTKPEGYVSKIWKIWKQRFLYYVAKNLSMI